jgi:hypothetical protein
MERKDHRMTLQEHYKTADDLAIATHHLERIYFRCQKHYPKSHKLMKLLWKVLPSALSGPFSTIKSELENEYFKAGHGDQDGSFIYYNLEKRYEKLKTPTP